MQIEVGVVDPHRLAEAGHPREFLAKPRDLMQLRLDVRLDPAEVDPAVGEPQRRGVEERHHADMHVGAAVLHGEEAQILTRESFVVGSAQRGLLTPTS